MNRKAAACHKVRHRSKQAAIIVWRKTGEKAHVNVYLCPECKAWHLGRSNSHFRFQQHLDQILGKRAYV